MAKSENTLVVTAALIVAVTVLAKSKSSAPIPKYKPTFIPGSQMDFIRKMYPVALTANKLYPKIPWQLFLTFSGLESGFGQHAPNWNFFGTKPGKGYTGQKQLLITHEILPKSTGYKFPEVISVMDSTKHPGKFDWKVKDYFRAYNTPLEAFRDFGAFISHGCYKKAENVQGIAEKLKQIKACGYATDPDYVAKQMKLISVVEEIVNRYVK